MKFIISNDKQYLIYIDGEKPIVDNGHYFQVNLLDDEVKEILNSTGGFCANCTWRHIKEKNLQDVTTLLFCPIPQGNNLFMFSIVYLSSDMIIRDFIYDNNLYDFLYFKDKFPNVVGSIFDLRKIPSLNQITKEFKTPTPDFNIFVDGKSICFEDNFISDISVLPLKTDFIKRIAEYQPKTVEYRIISNHIYGIVVECKIIKADSTPLMRWEAYGLSESAKEQYNDAFTCTLPLNFLKNNAGIRFKTV
jgi:hypothetical protein